MVARGVDFDYVKTRVSLEGLLLYYGLLDEATRRTTAKGVELRLHCPFHKDTQPSLSVNVDTGLFNCFGCEAKGFDIYDFVVLKQGIAAEDKKRARYEAACLVAEWFGVESQRPTRRRSPRKKPQPEAQTVAEETKTAASVGVEDLEVREEPPEGVVVNPPLERPYTNLQDDHPYLGKRGLIPETITTFGVGFYPGNGLMRGRIVIPIHDHADQLVAYAGRWPGDEGWPEGEDKYKLPSREHGFSKSHIVFNLHRVLGQGRERVVVTEGYFDCMKITQAGFPCVALMGWSLSERQLELLCAHFRYLTIMMDGNEVGRKGTDACLLRLGRRRYVRAVEVPDGMEPDLLSLGELQRLLRYV